MIQSTTVLVFFLLSVMMLGYLLYAFQQGKRAHVWGEIFFMMVYAGIALIVLFPGLLRWFEDFFGIESAINFITYLSIFIAYFILFLLYRKSEAQRTEITKLNRELAIQRHRKKR